MTEQPGGTSPHPLSHLHRFRQLLSSVVASSPRSGGRAIVCVYVHAVCVRVRVARGRYTPLPDPRSTPRPGVLPSALRTTSTAWLHSASVGPLDPWHAFAPRVPRTQGNAANKHRRTREVACRFGDPSISIASSQQMRRRKRNEKTCAEQNSRLGLAAWGAGTP
jgi:hypothetical protein